MMASTLDMPHTGVGALHERLSFAEPFDPPAALRETPLDDWDMAACDAPILAYLYRQLRPRRHLEFGTWQGFGATLCLENCDATVWSINLWNGESADNGHWRYYTSVKPGTPIPPGANTRVTPRGNVAVQTDGAGLVGRLVHERNLGHRFAQIYCDSRDWDTSHYPADFFDTALIDGGHAREVVESDTRKALSVLRPGGAILWHDFCPDAAALEAHESVRGVAAGIEALHSDLEARCADLFWIEPSWLLMGIVR